MPDTSTDCYLSPPPMRPSPLAFRKPSRPHTAPAPVGAPTVPHRGAAHRIADARNHPL